MTYWQLHIFDQVLGYQLKISLPATEFDNLGINIEIGRPDSTIGNVRGFLPHRCQWCEFDPRDVQQLFGTPFSKVSLR